MARINIDLPERFAFSTEVPVLGMHINMAGHLDNAVLLGMVTEARLRFWVHLGYKPMDMEGVGGMVGDQAVVYKSEAFHGETLVIESAAQDFGKYGFDVAWRMSEKASGREVARGKTGVLCFDFKARKLTPIPPKLLQRLQNA